MSNKDRRRRDEDRKKREQDRRRQAEEVERRAETERRGEQLREGWRRRRPREGHDESKERKP